MNRSFTVSLPVNRNFQIWNRSENKCFFYIYYFILLRFATEFFLIFERLVSIEITGKWYFCLVGKSFCMVQLWSLVSVKFFQKVQGTQLFFQQTRNQSIAYFQQSFACEHQFVIWYAWFERPGCIFCKFLPCPKKLLQMPLQRKEKRWCMRFSFCCYLLVLLLLNW